MKRKPFVFVENHDTNVVTKHDFPEKFDGSIGNFLVSLAIEYGYGAECTFYIGNVA